MSTYVSDEVIEAILEEVAELVPNDELNMIEQALRHHLQTKEPPYNYEACDQAFEQWWKPYPRKIKKIECKKIWRRHWRKDNLPGVVAMLSTLEAQKRSEQWLKELKYIPHPTSYLNRGQWEDEVPGQAVVELSDEEKDLRDAKEGEYARRCAELSAAGNWNRITAHDLREDLGFPHVRA